MAEFIKEMLRGVFWSYQSLAFWLGLALFILWLFLPKVKWKNKMKQGFEAVSWSCKLLIILGLLFISTTITSYSMYTDQQKKIEENVKAKQDIRQKIRSCLESIDPEILRRIDAGRKEILVCIGTQDAVKLSNLSERGDFDEYLSFRQVTLKDDFSALEDPNIYIENDKYVWVSEGHYLYPKDALRNRLVKIDY